MTPSSASATSAASHGALAQSLRVGTDVVDVREVESSLRRFGDRYLRRLFTEEEIAYCGTGDAVSAERLAARFAAKEATLKVLRPVDWWPSWSDIEVTRDPGGWCAIRLHGSAAELAAREGVQIVSCSLAHERAYATAVVLAVGSAHDTPERHSPPAYA